MSIVSLLSEDTVLPKVKVQTKDEVLNKLIDTLRSRVDANELDSIRKAVLEREEIMSTGVGKGLAIPHGKTSGVKENYAAFATLSEPIEYEAIDEEPVSLLFLLVGPQSSNSLHIKLLSRISRLMNNVAFREALSECTTSEEILKAFESEEQLHFGT